MVATDQVENEQFANDAYLVKTIKKNANTKKFERNTVKKKIHHDNCYNLVTIITRSSTPAFNLHKNNIAYLSTYNRRLISHTSHTLLV